jgi:glycosyltransferase involved in cell wall biosynthesis
MLKVSILLAVYNSELYIKDAIESVLSQSHSNFELIVVLNGCSDGSEAIVKSFVDLDDRVKMYVLLEKGKNIAYNKAFHESSGDLICYFAADDILAVDSIEKRVYPFLNNNSDNIFSSCCLESFSINKSLDGIRYPRVPGKPNFSGGSIMFSRSSASYIFPLPTSLPNEDTYTQIILRLIAENIHIPEYLYHYRLHESNSYSSSLSFANKKAGFIARISAFDMVLDKIDSLPVINFDYLKDVESVSLLNNSYYMSLFSIKVPISHKLVFLGNTNRFFYLIKNSLNKFLSGLIKQI